MQSPWWQDAVVYHVYPRSFQDTNDDGIGDLQGITQRLSYLAWLGVDAVWLSPVYHSPQRDFGYDITDHTDVDPLFGSLADFDELLDKTHSHGLRVILDFVPNHTSIDHPWFAQSRTARDNPRRTWYIWRDPGPDGAPPNNWRAVTGGPAWTFDARTSQYYLHSFLPTQPDLNWRNPDVEQAMHAVMRFWLDRGVDGLRIDMVDYLVKDSEFRDEPTDEHGRYEPADARYHLNQPETLDLMRGFRRLTDTYTPPRLLVGEVEYRLPLPRLASYYGAGDLLHLPINFWLMFLDWNAQTISRFVDAYQSALPPGAWPNWVLGSHDISRPATRLGFHQARAALLILLTLRGTPFLYYGDELGLADVPVTPEQVQDPWGIAEPGAGRDPARTPMPWTGGPNGGFCRPHIRPWLPVDDHHHRLNVVAQQNDSASTLALTHDLLALRRSRSALRTGTCSTGPCTEDSVLSYRREQGKDQLQVLVNMSNRPATVHLDTHTYELLVSTHRPRNTSTYRGSLSLRSYEGCVLAVRQAQVPVGDDYDRREEEAR